MISKCANPACSASFRYLHEGKLFRFERKRIEEARPFQEVDPGVRKNSGGIEFFWLCDQCAATMTLTYRKGIGVTPSEISGLKAAS